MTDSNPGEGNESANISERYRFYRYVVVGATVVAAISSSWIPLTMANQMVKALAGQSTTFGLTLSVTLGISIVISGIPVALLFRKANRQTKEMVRLRARLEAIEDENKNYRRMIASWPTGKPSR